MLPVWKPAALLAARCTVVIKPSEETPPYPLHLAALPQEAGFPDGAINVVTCYGNEVRRAFCQHPHVAQIRCPRSPEPAPPNPRPSRPSPVSSRSTNLRLTNQTSNRARARDCSLRVRGPTA
ncbi:hypothetical protein B1218_37425, partial [Pseudomonas ogarae]